MSVKIRDLSPGKIKHSWAEYKSYPTAFTEPLWGILASSDNILIFKTSDILLYENRKKEIKSNKTNKRLQKL